MSIIEWTVLVLVAVAFLRSGVPKVYQFEPALAFWVEKRAEAMRG